jgi:hypothetical protein
MTFAQPHRKQSINTTLKFTQPEELHKVTDDEFLSLVPGTVIYHRSVPIHEATVETVPIHHPKKLWRIFGKPKLSELVVQIIELRGTRKLLRGGSEQAREWCLNLKETLYYKEPSPEEARLSQQENEQRDKERIERKARQEAEKLARFAARKRAAGPHRNTANWVCLRSNELDEFVILSKEEAKACIIRLNLFDSKWNPTGRFEKEFVTTRSPVTVVERRTGLMWQRNVDLPSGRLSDAGDYIDELNYQRFAGFDDWRIPTLEEAATLLDPHPQGSPDPVFGSPHSDPEGTLVRATGVDDPVLRIISECNNSQREPEPPSCIITSDHAPGWEPYEVRSWQVDFFDRKVTDYYEEAECLACRSIGADEVYGA